MRPHIGWALAAACGLVLALRGGAGLAEGTRTLQVGPDKPYTTPAQAAAAARDGDIIAIDAGAYPGDVAVWRANNLTICGVGGRVVLDAQGRSADGKAIWVIAGHNTTVEQIEFTGCTVPDKNGAGIRLEGAGLTVRNCVFRDNENGILAGAHPESDIRLEGCEFARNGHGDGYSHNIYINRVRSFTLSHCYSHHGNSGHLVKSRAEHNYLLYNRLTDEAEGRSSYVVNLPNGGRSYLIGNIIQHGPQAENRTLVAYADEGASNPVQELYVVFNTFVNARRDGCMLRIAGSPANVLIMNNIFSGAATVVDGAGIPDACVISDAPGFVDAAQYDYRLTRDSPARGAGNGLGLAAGFSLQPAFEYRHPCAKTPRPPFYGGHPDIGAHQYTWTRP